MCPRYVYIFIVLSLICIFISFLEYRFSLSTWISTIKLTIKTNRNSPLLIILTREPTPKVIQQSNELIEVGIETLIMSDTPLKNENSKYFSRLHYVDDATLKSYGLNRNRAWDRVFVWLYNQSSIEYVWIMEDDFAWANANDVKSFFNQYATDQTDLLARNIIYWSKKTLGWIWWPRSRLKLFPQTKWSGSLNMLVRVSRQLIKAHQKLTVALFDEIQRDQTLKFDKNFYFQEFFIPTVAHINHLSMVIYDNSKLDVHVSPLSEEDIRKSWQKGNRLFHPVKHQSDFLFHQLSSSVSEKYLKKF